MVVVVVSVVACLTCELCFGTSRSVLDPSWFGLRPFPCVKGTYLRLDFKGPAPPLTQVENEKFRRQQAPTIVSMFWTNVHGKKKGPCFSLLRKPFNCRSRVSFSLSLASFQNSPCVS